MSRDNDDGRLRHQTEVGHEAEAREAMIADLKVGYTAALHAITHLAESDDTRPVAISIGDALACLMGVATYALGMSVQECKQMAEAADTDIRMTRTATNGGTQ